MIEYDKALKIIKDEICKLTLNIEEVDLLESINRILAEDIIADVDLPPFDNSAMDGYAIKFSNRKEWEVIGEILAGNFKEYNLNENEAIAITTGSKLPYSADTVIPLEEVELKNNIIHLREGAFLKKGMNVRVKGNDLEKDKIALPKFTKLDAKALAVLASCGKGKVKVFKKLITAILATGDELIPINEIPTNDKLRVSNIYSLYAATIEYDQMPIMLGFVKDDKEVIRNKIAEALEMDIDLLITTGGVSVGKYDLLKDIFEELGVEIKFWKANIKPGKPIVFGIYNKENRMKFVFGLPGNPVSSLVSFYVFIKPAISSLFKQKGIDFVYAELENDLKKNDNKRHFFRGVLFYDESKLKVSSTFSQSSGNLVEMSRSNCLIEIPEDIMNPKKGDIVKCITI